MSDNIYVTIVRTGKDEVTETVSKGSTVRQVFDKAGIAPATYEGWSIQDEDGQSLVLNSTLQYTTALICGARVNGAA